MVQREISKSGVPILTASGRLLCSRVDPMKEAQRWVASHRQVIETVPSILVLGIGSGFHVAELCRQFPGKKILVIESNFDLAASVEDLLGFEMPGVDILTEQKVETVLRSSRLHKAITQVYSILAHAPSMSLDPDFYDEVLKYLIGREKSAFLFQMKLRGEFDQIFDLQKLMTSESTLLSIEDLNKALTNDHRGDPKAMAIQCLREFVK